MSGARGVAEFLAAGFCLALACASLVRAQDRPANAGLDHPDVVAVRTIYRAVEKDIAAKRLRKEERHLEECAGGLGEARTIYSGAGGAIRKSVWQGGSSDSALTLRHYYDGQGRLRFVFVTGGAVNGTLLEHRIWLDEEGRRIRETRRLQGGPGWTFPQFTDEEGWLIRDARRALDVRSAEPAPGLRRHRECAEEVRADGAHEPPRGATSAAR